ncbi:tRNA sulfurtransferase ThiI [Moorella glycerini]|uniref:Probable tRNA sulfurtransferase n=1 Tax=Neomoorella stamsii TaxID=1266720 RepID=A0A9X7J396_9FIRM|nr:MULTISPECIES: tRNA uracil 4-sulfurtransferase ThiI [Moorella]PRR73737.1 putative tRNA sulfurtransferase [Moorella stamsii]CEP66317.1 tRNA sulfurtransferase ThiI [Moorella glycerini]
MYTSLLVRYGEISLKGNNRPYFEDKLLANMRRALGDLPPRMMRKTFGRVFVDLHDDLQAVSQRLQRVFGIISMSPVVTAPLELEAIKKAALAVLKDSPGTTFKVQTQRPNKRFPLTSPEVNQQLGAYLLTHNQDQKVDVHTPDRVIHVEIRDEGAYIYSRIIPGPGGLPVGVTGRGLLLISGGIDSPVAGYMGLKRGLELTALHFYSFPFTSERSKEKVIDLCRVLAGYSGPFRLVVAPFTAIQKAIRQHCPEEFYVTIMRRMMFRIARAVAAKEDALAILTGESLGQVASQTLQSMAVINKVVDLPVLRPLVAWDKSEIIEVARRIGTYDISIRPYEDCCTLFVPRHPATKPPLARVEAAEKKLAVEELMDECLGNLEILTVEPEDTGI